MNAPIFRPLAELCSRDITLVNPRNNADGEFCYIDISAVDNAKKQITSPKQVKGKDASVRARQLIQKNDVLVATTRPNLNAVALVPEQYDGEICSTGFCVLRPNAELDPVYLFHFVQSEAFIAPLVDLTQGALYPAVTDNQVFSQMIPWVPVPDQRQIAARLQAQLAEVEIARQAALRQLRDLEALPQRILAQAFEN